MFGARRGLGGAIGPRRRGPGATPLAGEPWARKEGPLGTPGPALALGDGKVRRGGGRRARRRVVGVRRPRRDGGLVGGRSVATGGWWTHGLPPGSSGTVAVSATPSCRRPASTGCGVRIAAIGAAVSPGRPRRPCSGPSRPSRSWPRLATAVTGCRRPSTACRSSSTAPGTGGSGRLALFARRPSRRGPPRVGASSPTRPAARTHRPSTWCRLTRADAPSAPPPLLDGSRGHHPSLCSARAANLASPAERHVAGR